jgi:type II secretory pathway pseudopilin PulG
MLVGLLVAIALILLVLAMAAPKVAQDLRRDREVEAVHRGDQYVRAIRRFYLKNGNHYPSSMEQLEKTNNIRFLRQRYLDPVTGLDDWRVIPVGQNKTTVKGFFGQPLAGIPSAGLGSAAGMASGVGVQTAPAGAAGAGAPGATPPGGAPSGTDPSSGGSSSGSGSTFGVGTSSGLGSAGGIGSSTASSFGSSGGEVFMGVGLNHTGDSVLDLNEQTTYETWEFLYDPRIEALKAKTSLLGGAPVAAPGTNGPGGTPGTGIGGTPPSIVGPPGTGPGTGTTGGAGTQSTQ